MLFDLLELQTYGTVRAELIGIVENFIPTCSARATFRSVAYILREVRVLLERARELIPEHRQTLAGLPGRCRRPKPSPSCCSRSTRPRYTRATEELSETFRELRAEALPTLMSWIPRLTNERVRDLVGTAAARLAQDHAAEVLMALASPDSGAQLEMVRLAGRLKLPGRRRGWDRCSSRTTASFKLAVVDALMHIASPAAMRLLERAVGDGDRDVRIAAVKFLASRGHRNALARVEAAVMGAKLRDTDLTEKMAFYEAYGTLAGPKGIAVLEKVLAPRGLLAKREDPETRACAAMALGKIRTPEARAVLEKTAQDKEALVRNAVSRALREVGS